MDEKQTLALRRAAVASHKDYDLLAFRRNLDRFTPETHRLSLWKSVRKELKEPDCHMCYAGYVSKGPCGWAYMWCVLCDKAYCAEYFYRW